MTKRDGSKARLRSPDERHGTCSQGRLRFVGRFGKQLVAPAAIVAVALAGNAAISAQVDAARASEQQEQVAQVRAAQARVEAGEKVRALVARQQFLSEIEQAHFADAGESAEQVQVVEPQPPETVFADAARITGLAAQLPELSAIETEQFAKVAQLTAQAEERAASAERAIRRAGLNPRLVVARIEDRTAQGGPLEIAEGLDPRFTALGTTVARMSALERGLDTIPTHLPASLDFISSGFGFRSDPFTGAGAMHAGLDFRGPTGAPIQAAADGTVTFAGVKGGYGNCIEVTHADGLMTRYGHMSAFKARTGQKVAAGDVIGAIGSTGRSTGPHLHFEVRINGAAVNPRPFLEART